MGAGADALDRGTVTLELPKVMSDRPFVHLHCHTDYSLLDGACDIKQLMNVVERQKMPAVAMTDHGNLFGAVEFYTEATATASTRSSAARSTFHNKGTKFARNRIATTTWFFSPKNRKAIKT